MGKTNKYSEDLLSCDGCGDEFSHLKATRGGRFCHRCFGDQINYTKTVERVWREDKPLK